MFIEAVLLEIGMDESIALMSTLSQAVQALNEEKAVPHKPGLLSKWKPPFNLHKSSFHPLQVLKKDQMVKRKRTSESSMQREISLKKKTKNKEINT